jgi:pimeloyl-ACP methyl ester carboxylesterase
MSSRRKHANVTSLSDEEADFVDELLRDSASPSQKPAPSSTLHRGFRSPRRKPVSVGNPMLDERASESTLKTFDTADFFNAFNLRPKPTAGHRARPELYGPPPVFITSGTTMWTPSTGQRGLVPVQQKNGKRATHDMYYGLDIPEIIKGTNGVKAEEQGTFVIRWSVCFPQNMNAWQLDKLPLIGLMHGVPTNRRWKIELMRELGQHAVVVAIDMLGMGESDQVLSMNLPGRDDLSAWDWEYDVEYVRQVMMKDVPKRLGMTPNKPWIFSSDDWGAGIGLRYLAKHREDLVHKFFVNPIWLDGYFVIEIGTIGKLAKMWSQDYKSFKLAAFGLPQAIIGIEKYMVEKRYKMNRYTESDFLFPYQDVNYQSGKDAYNMPQNFWNLAVLAERASRLAPRQLQPYDEKLNESGVRNLELIQTPITIIWGLEDQMMPPSQVFRSAYLFPNAPYNYVEIPGANHFSEIDNPDAVVRAMINEIIRHPRHRDQIFFLGNGHDRFVMKGDEEELLEKLKELYS